MIFQFEGINWNCYKKLLKSIVQKQIEAGFKQQQLMILNNKGLK